jgi:hypothetical protein
MKPFYTVWLRYGTTLPETLRQKSIDPYLIVSSCPEFRNSQNTKPFNLVYMNSTCTAIIILTSNIFQFRLFVHILYIVSLMDFLESLDARSKLEISGLRLLHYVVSDPEYGEVTWSRVMFGAC